MRFSTGVFIIDGFLAALIVTVGPWPLALIAAFIAGGVAMWLWKERDLFEHDDVYFRFRHADQQGRAEVETALRESERRRFVKPFRLWR